MSVESKIRQLIDQNGYVPCDVLMQEVLNLNPISYYRQVKSLAAEGDFVTAPEVSQLFGEIIGLWCIKEWQRIGCPKSLSLVELGPGRGLLMRDLLRTAKLVPEFYQALSIELIEINQNFIAHQKSNLQDTNLPIKHLSFIEDIPKKPTIIIANEFFDAMPIKQYIKVKELWYERIFVVQPVQLNSESFRQDEFKDKPAERIKIREQRRGLQNSLVSSFLNDAVDGRIKYDKISVNKQLQEYLLRTHIEAKDGAVLEESYKSIEIIKFIAEHINKLSGSCLIIDYGYDISPGSRTRHQYNPTLQAVKNHKYCPILENLGEDFYALKTVAENSSMNVIDTISQRDFLIENGILLRSKTLQDKLDAKQAQLIEKQVERLISPKQMGALFKVLQIMN